MTFQVTTSSDSARVLFWSAYTDLLHHFEGRAVEALDRALALDSTFGLARLLRAHPGYLATSGRYSAAEREREIEQGTRDALRTAGTERLLALAWRELFRGDPAAADSILSTAVQLEPSSPHLALEHAMVPLQNAQPNVSLRRLESVRSRFPDFAPVYMPLAYALRESGDTARAIQIARNYARLVPHQPYSYFVIARFLRDAGRFEAAAESFRPVLDLPRSWFDPYEILAALELLRGDGGAAREVLTTAISDEADAAARADRLRYLAITHLYDGNVAEAKRLLMRAARDAELAGASGPAALAYRFLALLDGAFGTGAEIPGNLSLALRADPAGSHQHAVFAAHAFALAERMDSARHYVNLLERGASTANTPWRDYSIALARVSLAEGDADRALHELHAIPGDAPFPLVAWVRVDAYEALEWEEEASRLRDLWLRPDNLNLRSLPHAIVWRKLRGTEPIPALEPSVTVVGVIEDASPNRDSIPVQVALSPDGRLLAYSTRGDLRVWNLATGERHVLARGNFHVFTWAPRSDALAATGFLFDDPRRERNLWVVPVDPLTGAGAGEPRLAGLGPVTHGAHFSPDGRWIAYPRYVPSTSEAVWYLSELVVVPVSGGRERVLGRAINIGVHRWSADGSTVYYGAFAEPGSPAQEIFAVPVTGGTSRPVGPIPDVPWPHYMDPVTGNVLAIYEVPPGVRITDWTDNHRTAIAGMRKMHPRGIRIVNLRDGTSQDLLPATSEIGTPVWFATGDGIGVIVRDEGDPYLLTMDVDGSHRRIYPFSTPPDSRGLGFDDAHRVRSGRGQARDP